MHAKLHGRHHERGLFASGQQKRSGRSADVFVTENTRHSIIIRNWVSFFAILSSRVIPLAKCAALKQKKKKEKKKRVLTDVNYKPPVFLSYLFARIANVASSNSQHAEVLISQRDLLQETVDTLNQILSTRHIYVSPRDFSEDVLKTTDIYLRFSEFKLQRFSTRNTITSRSCLLSRAVILRLFISYYIHYFLTLRVYYSMSYDQESTNV